jgi:hypothetical protein
VVLSAMFEEWIIPEEGQGLLATPTQWLKVLNMFPGGFTWLADELDRDFSKPDATPKSRWTLLQARVRDTIAQLRKKPSEHPVRPGVMARRSRPSRGVLCGCKRRRRASSLRSFFPQSCSRSRTRVLT